MADRGITPQARNITWSGALEALRRIGLVGGGIVDWVLCEVMQRPVGLHRIEERDTIRKAG
jgi:hypothetical protein